MGVPQKNDLILDALRGAAAGAVGVFAMDFFVTDPMYRHESRAAYGREKKAQVDGKWAAQAAVMKITHKTGIHLSERQNFLGGQVVHYVMGIGPGAIYSVLRRRMPVVAKGRGLLYGFALFILADEITVPAAGATSGPTKYPWQNHLRGLLGHLMMGYATHTAIEELEFRARRARTGQIEERWNENEAGAIAA